MSMPTEGADQHELNNLRRDVRNLELMKQALEAALIDARRRADGLEGRLTAVYQSTSWRLSAPLRWLARLGRTRV